MREKIHTSTLFAMDTVMEIEVEGDEELIAGAEEKIRHLERALSVTDENSEIGILNKTGSAKLSPETSDIMKKALKMCDETDGALDITVYPVLKAWGFTTGVYRVPDDKEIEELLEHVDYKKVALSGAKAEYSEDKNIDTDSLSVSIPEGFEVDLGSVAKGYTSQLIYDYFKENGVEHALINLGGNVQCLGTKPNGQKWKVAIKAPFPDSKSGIYGVLEAADTAIITSGGYERYFEEDGLLYWHIIDPKTGRPARNTLASVTIIGRDGLRCDALSTALFVKGLDEAIAFWKSFGDFDAILITEDNEVYITPGIYENFTLSSEYHSAPLHVLTK